MARVSRKEKGARPGTMSRRRLRESLKKNYVKTPCGWWNCSCITFPNMVQILMYSFHLEKNAIWICIWSNACLDKYRIVFLVDGVKSIFYGISHTHKEVVRLAYLGISRLVLTYFLSQNTIHSTSRTLFILPAEHKKKQSIDEILSS
jgi:hypothetical protein